MQPSPTRPSPRSSLTFLGLIVQALTDRGADVISGREWFVIVVGSLVTTGVVYGVTNPPA